MKQKNMNKPDKPTETEEQSTAVSTRILPPTTAETFSEPNSLDFDKEELSLRQKSITNYL